jgi:hypothetical protein
MHLFWAEGNEGQTGWEVLKLAGKYCCIFQPENNSGAFKTLEVSKTPECNNTGTLLLEHLAERLRGGSRGVSV